jgi:dGTPase
VDSQNSPRYPPKGRAVEAEIMDWADDVTYSVHDVEDFFRAGLIPLHLLNRRGEHPSRERERFFNFILENDRKDAVLRSLPPNEIEKIFDDLLIFATSGFAFDDPYEGSREDHAKLRMFSSRLIGRFINALTLDPARSVDARPVLRQMRAEQEVAILKQLTWFYVIEAPSLAIQRQAQAKVINRLGEIFLHEAASEKPSGVFPVFFRNQLREPGLTLEDRRRTAIDLLSNMTEQQAIEMYQRLEGISVASGFDKIVG